jgi:hypothetical protein
MSRPSKKQNEPTIANNSTRSNARSGPDVDFVGVDYHARAKLDVIGDAVAAPPVASPP